MAIFADPHLEEIDPRKGRRSLWVQAKEQPHLLQQVLCLFGQGCVGIYLRSLPSQREMPHMLLCLGAARARALQTRSRYASGRIGADCCPNSPDALLPLSPPLQCARRIAPSPRTA